MDSPTSSNPRRPNVTGLSPKEGVPGTQITIRGEYLGTGQNDVISVLINGCECVISARWETPSKIIARVGRARAGVGEVIVATRSGGVGVCAVQFRVFHIQIGPTQETAVWVDESRTVPGRASAASAAAAVANELPMGDALPARANRRMTVAQLAQLFPDGSGNIKMENFVPAYYLLEQHRGATLDELRTGLKHMKAQSRVADEGPRDVIKHNLHSFMTCIDALYAARESLGEAKTGIGWPLTARMESLVVEAHDKADTLFSKVLSRKDTADATRNALNVLTRFQFIFNLPSQIDKRVAENEYGTILSEYSRAKSLYADSDQPLFQEALAEVDARMLAFTQTLRRRLLEVNGTSLDTHRKTIKYLLMLDPSSDPGLDCLHAHHAWVEAQLWAAQDRYYRQAKMRRHLSTGSMTPIDDTTGGGGGELPERYEFVESVLALLSGRLRDVHQLALAYIDGSLSTHNNLHRQGEIESLLGGTVTLASWLMLNALLPDTVPERVLNQYGERLVKWPPHNQDTSTTHELGNALRSLRHMRVCINHLIALDAAGDSSTTSTGGGPWPVLQALVELTLTLRIQIVSLCTQVTVARIIQLADVETWRPVTSTPGTDDAGARTQLPTAFEAIVIEVLPVLRQVVMCTYFVGESELPLEHVNECMLRLLVSFTHTLVQLVRLSPTAKSDQSITQTPQRPATLPIDANIEQPQLVKDRRILITLANCDYCIRHCVPTVCTQLGECGVVGTDSLCKRADVVYGELRAQLLQAYTAVKCRPFAGIADDHEYEHAAADEDATIAVSNYIKDTLLCAVGVQAELFLHAQHFTQSVMCAVVHDAGARLSERVTNARAACSVGRQCVCATQMMLDVRAFMLAFGGYVDAVTRQKMQSAQVLVEGDADESVIKSCISEYRQSMRLALLALSNLSGETADV